MTGLHIVHNREEGTIGFAMPSSMFSCIQMLYELNIDTGRSSVYPTSYQRSKLLGISIIGIIIVTILVIVIFLYTFL